MWLGAITASPASVRHHRELIEEHIDDAAFLYGQRRTMLEELEEPWSRVASVEQRIEAHVDALVVAGPPAVESCIARAAVPTEPGEDFVATCLMCRLGKSREFAALLQGIRSDEIARRIAVRDALRVELPGDWTPFVESALRGGSTWVAALADVSLHRRLPVGAALLDALQQRVATPVVARALGELDIEEARSALWRCLNDEEEETRAEALVALCRLGDVDALAQGINLARTERWARKAVGLAGGPQAVQTLLSIARGEGLDVLAIEALGLLGDPAGIEALHGTLSQESLAPTAARALQWITGAALCEQSFIPDPIDDAALTESERQAKAAAQGSPTRADGRPFGESVQRLTRDPASWERWLTDHAREFQPGWRYRTGRPCSPRVTLACLNDAGSDARLRRAAATEMKIRYGCPITIDVDLPVATQRAALAQALAWVEQHGNRFAPGHWTSGGQRS